MKQITLIGVGLIGGSFVLDLKRLKKVSRVIGVDLDCANLSRALERRVIDVAFDVVCQEAIRDSDLILIATPVAALPSICAKLNDWLPENSIVSDVGSTKQSVIAAFRDYLPRHFTRCVAAHPIAGSDRSGALAAQFGLYQDKKLILCPHEAQDFVCLNMVQQLWQDVGANTHILSASEHDEIFAAVSHLPHLLAFSYMHQLLDNPNGKKYVQFAGSGFRDFTRIAGSSPDMWRDVLLANQDSLLNLIEAQKQQLDYLSGCLKNGNVQALYKYICQASKMREQWGENH